MPETHALSIKVLTSIVLPNFDFDKRTSTLNLETQKAQNLCS